MRYFIGPQPGQFATIDKDDGPVPDYLSGYTEVNVFEYDQQYAASQAQLEADRLAQAALVQSAVSKLEAVAGLSPEERAALFGV